MNAQTFSQIVELFKSMSAATNDAARLLLTGKAMSLYCTGSVSWDVVMKISTLGAYCSMLDEADTLDEFAALIDQAKRDERLGLAWTYLTCGQWMAKQHALFAQTNVGKAWQHFADKSPQEILESVPYNTITHITR